MMERQTLTMADFCDFSGQILSGLEHIHAAGLIHRDVKCENVLVKRMGNGRAILKVTDFGSAQNQRRLDFTSLVSGTLKFMAPEMLSVKDPWFSIRKSRRYPVNLPLIVR